MTGADKSHGLAPGATSFSSQTAKIISSACPWVNEMYPLQLFFKIKQIPLNRLFYAFIYLTKLLRS